LILIQTDSFHFPTFTHLFWYSKVLTKVTRNENMTIRYEANPPKILPDVNTEESITKFINRIKEISKKCDAIHLTENVLGFQRISPIEIGKIIKKEIPNFPITVSLRVRDKTEKEIDSFVEECIKIGFSGILILMGDPSQTGKKDSGQIPSQVVQELRKKKIDSKIDLYLSISNKPNFSKIKKKLQAKPKGFMTQVIQNTEQAQNLSSNLEGLQLFQSFCFLQKKMRNLQNFCSWI